MNAKKTICAAVALLLTLQLPLAAMADPANNPDTPTRTQTITSSAPNADTQTRTETITGSGTYDCDVVVESGNGVAVVTSTQTPEPPINIEVTGSVTGSNYGVVAQAGSEESSISITVGGDVTGNFNAGVKATASDDNVDVTVEGNVTGNVYGVNAQKGADVTVGGNVTGNWIGVYADNGADVTVGGNVTSESMGIYAYNSASTVTVGGNVTSDMYGVQAFYGADVTVDGNVTSETTGVNAYASTVTVGGNVTGGAMGVSAITSTVTVSGNVTSNGGSGNDGSGNHGSRDGVWASEGGEISVDGNVQGTVTTKFGGVVTIGVDSESGVDSDIKEEWKELLDENKDFALILDGQDSSSTVEAERTAIYAQYEGFVFVDGDVKATNEEGTAVSVSDFDSTVVVNGDVTGSIEESGAGNQVFVFGDVNGKVTISGDNLLLVDGVLDLGDGVIMIESDHALVKDWLNADHPADNEGDAATPTIIAHEIKSSEEEFVAVEDGDASAIYKNINYIVKKNDADGASLTIQGCEQRNGLLLAKEDAKVTVNIAVATGYEVESVSGGKATVTKNADGTYTVLVPRGGGVDISAVLRAIAKNDPVINDVWVEPHTSTPVKAAPKYTSTDEAKTVHGLTLFNNVDVTTDAIAVVDTIDNVTVHRNISTIGQGAKLNDVPKDVQAIITAMDEGDLSSVPVQLADGAKAFGRSIRVKTKTESTITLYATREVKALAVLFYNILTGEWSVLDVTVDPATGLLNVTLPCSGILQLIEG